MTPAEATRLIVTHSVLGCLPADALDDLVKRSRVARYPKGAEIYRRGDPGNSLMVILSGRVKITNVTADAREVGLNFLGPGDLNGELAALDGKPRSANATAIEAVEALVLLRRDLIPVLTAHPAAMLGVIAALAGKLRAMSAAIEHAGLQMAAKAAAALIRLAEQHGRAVPDGTLIDLKLSQRDLGNYAGLSRENMNRQLAGLREAGLIRLEEARILILDAEGLSQVAERDL